MQELSKSIHHSLGVLQEIWGSGTELALLVLKAPQKGDILELQKIDKLFEFF